MVACILSTCTIGGIYSQNMPDEGTNALGFYITGLADVFIGNYNSTIISSAQVADPLEILPGGITVGELIPQNVLLYKRYYGNGWASRLNIGINSFSSKLSTADSVGDAYVTEDTKNSAFSLGLGIGMEKHMTPGTKVDPYLGADLNFAFLGKIKFSDDYSSVDPNVNSTVNSTIDYPGGMGIGLNLVGGFNYFFSDNISIGGEVGFGFNYTGMGGDWSSDTKSVTKVGNTTTTTDVMDQGTYKSTSSGFNVNTYGGVNLIVYWQ